MRLCFVTPGDFSKQSVGKLYREPSIKLNFSIHSILFRYSK
ncbi:hypothetical protein ACFP3I_20815 [Chryseobacterium arachidis]